MTNANILQKIESGELVFSDGKLFSSEDWAKIQEAEAKEEHYDLLQLTKKIQLNSAYGSILNENFRFGRREIGASVTGTGRQITRHMSKTIATKISGRPVELMKRFAPGEYDEDGMVIRTKQQIRDMLMPRRGRNQGRKVTEPFAIALQEGDMEMLMDLPTSAPRAYEYHFICDSNHCELLRGA